MGVEQAQLLAAVDGVERVVDVERDPLRHLPERGAVEVDHGAPHAQQRARVRQVLQARDRGLRAEVALRGQTIQGHLEHRVTAQAVGVVAVLVSRSDRQQAEADDVGERVHGAQRIARVGEAGGQPVRHRQTPFHLAQRQQPAVRGQPPAIETGHNGFSGDG